MGTVANRIIPTLPPFYNPDSPQKAEGGPLEAAANDTLTAQAKSAAAFKALGAGQKGSSRRRKRGGAATMNATFPSLPTANSMPGASAIDRHVELVDMKNQFAANAAGDKLANATPMQLGGKTKKRGSKAKHGRRGNRTHKRGSRKFSSRHGRGRHTSKK